MSELTIKIRNIREGLGSSKFSVVHPTKGEIFFSGYQIECNAFIVGYNMSKKEQEQLQAKRALWTKPLHESTIEELHNLNRDELIAMLVQHDRDGDYSDEQRIALGEEPLNHQQALDLAVINLHEVNE